MSNVPQRKRQTTSKPSSSKTKTAVPKKKPQRRRQKRQIIGLGIKTPSSRDYDYTLIQSRADTRTFDISAQVGTLQLGSENQILFTQSLSAVSAALLQQESQSDSAAQGTIENALLNYLDYRFTEIKITLKNATAEGVRGTFAVAFTPPNITFDKPDSFSKFVLGRAVDSKPYPGTRIITIEELRAKKSIVINAEFQKGGRPIGLSGVVQAGQATVGRVTIGMLTDAVTGQFATNQQPSSSTPTSPSQSVPTVRAVGEMALVSIDFKGEWIYYAPDQAATNDAVAALKIVNEIAADTIRVDPAGRGDWKAAFATGVAPPDLIKLVNNEVNLNRLRGTPANQDYLAEGRPLRTYLAESSGTSSAFFTSSTVKTVSTVALEAVASFAPPLIRQLIVWGGRTMIGLIDRYVNTQSSMKAKEQDVGVKNGTSSPEGSYPFSLSLTPTALNFTPGAQPFNNVPLNYPVQRLADQLRDMPTGSIGRNIYTMLVQCLLMGIYPFPFFESVPVGGDDTRVSFSVGDEVEVFVNNTGGVPTLVSTVINNDVTPPTDTYAGIPLFTRRNNGSFTLDNFAPTASTNAQNLRHAGPVGLIMTGGAALGPTAQYIVPDFYQSMGSNAFESLEHFSDMLAIIHPGYGTDPVTLAVFEKRLEMFFDHPVAVITPTVWAIALEFSYAARCSTMIPVSPGYPSDEYGIDTVMPGDSPIDSGCCKFTVLVDLTGVNYDTTVSFECVEYCRLDYQIDSRGVYSSFDPNRITNWDVGSSVKYFINHLKNRTY